MTSKRNEALFGTLPPDPQSKVEPPPNVSVGDVPNGLPKHLKRMLSEQPDDDRSDQTHAFVAACAEWGYGDVEILALAVRHAPTVAKYGTRRVEEAWRVLGKHRPLHAHVGQPCDRAGCPNTPAWMTGDPAPAEPKQTKQTASGQRKRAARPSSRPVGRVRVEPAAPADGSDTGDSSDSDDSSDTGDTDQPAGPGAALLDELHAALTRYVIFPSPEAAVTVALWVAATHAQPAWEHAPRLPVVSPEKRCGKSRLLDVIAETCHAPLVTVNATVAAVVRSIDHDPPTLLVDEADTIFGSRKQAENHEELRGILNAGHMRNRPMIRWDLTTRSLEELPTFAMAALASIGDLPDTIMDRGPTIRMRRRRPGERVAPYRTRRDGPPLNGLRDRLRAWARGHLDELREAVPAMPLEDRAADTWEPLLAIADQAGGCWPGRGRTAARKLTGEAAKQDARSDGVRLLADLRAIFGDTDALYTRTILDELHGIEESPWGDWHGKPLAARDLAGLLHRYGVTSKDVREGGTGTNFKGYRRAELHDAWERYAPLPRQPRQPRQDDEAAAQPGRGPVAGGPS